MFSFFNLILIIQNVFKRQYAFKSLPGIENIFTTGHSDYVGYVLAYSLQFFLTISLPCVFPPSIPSKQLLQKSVLLNPMTHQTKSLEVPADFLV